MCSITNTGVCMWAHLPSFSLDMCRFTQQWISIECELSPGPTEGILGRTRRANPTSGLGAVAAWSHQPSANHPSNIATSCRGVRPANANQRHPAPGPELPHWSHCVPFLKPHFLLSKPQGIVSVSEARIRCGGITSFYLFRQYVWTWIQMEWSFGGAVVGVQ